MHSATPRPAADLHPIYGRSADVDHRIERASIDSRLTSSVFPGQPPQDTSNTSSERGTSMNRNHKVGLRPRLDKVAKKG